MATESSGGTVTDIAPGASPWLVAATYRQGSSEYYYPSVKAVDNKGALSLAGYAKLGVSGWETEVVTSDTIYSLGFQVQDMAIDPANGQLVVAGSGSHGLPSGCYFARRDRYGVWQTEQIIDYASEEWSPGGEDIYGRVNDCHIGWNTSGQPVVILNSWKALFMGGITRIFCKERSASGEWNFVSGASGEGAPAIFPLMGSIARAASLTPTHFVVLCSEVLDIDRRYGLLWYDNGVWSIEDTGYKQATYSWVMNPAFDSTGTLHMTAKDDGVDKYAIWIYTRNGAGDWIEQQVTDSNMADGSTGMGPSGLMFSAGNEPQFLLTRGYSEESPYLRNISIATCKASGVEELFIARTNGISTDSMRHDARGISVFYNDSPGTEIKRILYHTRIEGMLRIDETIYAIPTSAGDAGASIHDTATDDSGHVFAILGGREGEFGQGFSIGQMFAERVDPRTE